MLSSHCVYWSCPGLHKLKVWQAFIITGYHCIAISVVLANCLLSFASQIQAVCLSPGLEPCMLVATCPPCHLYLIGCSYGIESVGIIVRYNLCLAPDCKCLQEGQRIKCWYVECRFEGRTTWQIRRRFLQVIRCLTSWLATFCKLLNQLLTSHASCLHWSKTSKHFFALFSPFIFPIVIYQASFCRSCVICNNFRMHICSRSFCGSEIGENAGRLRLYTICKSMLNLTCF